MAGPLGDLPRGGERTYGGGAGQRVPWGTTTADVWRPRALPEQCDNGGLTLHGCTRLC
jgi:hypothetical protein